MIWFALLLFVIGLFFSAFFSGSETGFYRVNRVRLVLDALSGDRVAGLLLRLTNNPALFVATTLIGNNVANNITSFAIVLGAGQLPESQRGLAEGLLPLLISPVIFVYGELLPKNLFFQAPNRLLRVGGPLFLVCAVFFAPLAGVLWALGRLLQSLVGQTPLRVQLTLARKELGQLLREGQEAGILRPVQRQLAQALVRISPRPISAFLIPIGRIVSVPMAASKSDVYRLARRQRAADIPVRDSGGREFVGYVNIVALHLSAGERVKHIDPLPRLPHDLSHAAALVRLRADGAHLALVVDDQDAPIGMISADHLVDELFRGEQAN